MPGDDIEWRVSDAPVPYPDALAEMDERAAAIAAGAADERIWLLEHPPLYTAGTSAAPAELLSPDRFPVYVSGRGGRYTYHGPGQRIGYVQLDLAGRGRDVRRYVHALEDWVIAALGLMGVTARSIPGRIGIWVGEGAAEAKIGAIGVRVRRWVTMHGFAINVDPDLAHFAGIVPCGLAGHGVTSLAALGISAGMSDVDEALRRSAPRFIGLLARR